MNTPIADFVKNYSQSNISRMHMPGHKGKNFIGAEKYDITEIDGADVLSSADGIIKQSEDNATNLFGSAHTFYITQGSTTAIYSMLALVTRGKTKPLIVAARNVHKAFINGCALLDIDVSWINDDNSFSIIECIINDNNVENAILNCQNKPCAVYVTSPDYLGNILDIKGISHICNKYDIPLIVDNAHGAYLKFTDKSLHPIDLGATMCCDSAHKTLPVLTGGAYLHISENAPKKFLQNARDTINTFCSTSPSYLIMQSLDVCNKYLHNSFKTELAQCINKVNKLKQSIIQKGFNVLDGEPLKIVIDCNDAGYYGSEIAEIFRNNMIEPEFYDDTYLVLMVTPQNSDIDYNRIETAICGIPIKMSIEKSKIKLSVPKQVMSIRNAVFGDCETIDTEKALGRICASPTVSCPPAVPIAISGEEITQDVANMLKHYGINKIKVIKK